MWAAAAVHCYSPCNQGMCCDALKPIKYQHVTLLLLWLPGWVGLLRLSGPPLMRKREAPCRPRPHLPTCSHKDMVRNIGRVGMKVRAAQSGGSMMLRMGGSTVCGPAAAATGVCPPFITQPFFPCSGVPSLLDRAAPLIPGLLGELVLALVVLLGLLGGLGGVLTHCTLGAPSCPALPHSPDCEPPPLPLPPLAGQAHPLWLRRQQVHVCQLRGPGVRQAAQVCGKPLASNT